MFKNNFNIFSMPLMNNDNKKKCNKSNNYYLLIRGIIEFFFFLNFALNSRTRICYLLIDLVNYFYECQCSSRRIIRESSTKIINRNE